MTKKIIVMAGLPGSGKTTKAEELADQELANQCGKNTLGRIKVKVWNFDKYPMEKLLKEIDSYFDYYDVHILDGLFIRKRQYQKVINEFEYRNVEFEFHYFEFDVESCLWNDKYRRDVDSTITLENALYEYPDLEKLDNKKHKISIFKHPVERKSLVNMFIHKYHSSEYRGQDDDIVSNSWTTGGDWRDCWGGGGEFKVEEPLEEFEELIELLLEIDPNMSYSICQEIKDKIVDIEENSESDYYGGCKYFSYYKTTYSRVYETLVELGIINPEEL